MIPETWKERRETQVISSRGNHLLFWSSWWKEDLYQPHQPDLNPELQEPGDLLRIATGEKSGYYYPSAGHAQFTELEERLRVMEMGQDYEKKKGIQARIFPRGMAAISATLEAIRLMQGEGKIIHHEVMYPSTKKILNTDLIPGLEGIEVDLKTPENLEAALEQHKGQVKGVIYEPISNPTIEYLNTRTIAEIAHRHDVPVIADNTLLTPFLQAPFLMGADIVIHSLTKYYSGQGDILGGVVIAPDEYIDTLQMIRKEKGLTMAPQIAKEYAERVPYLPERMARHMVNAERLARDLRDYEWTQREHSQIQVQYPDLNRETHEGSAGGMVSFQFSGTPDQGFERSQRFTRYLCDHPGIVKQAVSFAEPKTVVLPWAGQVPDKEFLQANNIPFGLVRIGVGREDGIHRVAEYLVDAITYSAK